jgi:sugar lactone lactonase YvrE
VGVAVDTKGNLDVADTGNQVIRKMTAPPAGSSPGQVSLPAGQPGAIGYQDTGLTGNAALFNHPGGAAVDKNGNVFVAETGHNAIREITPDGTVATPAGNPEAACDPTQFTPGITITPPAGSLFFHVVNP